MKSVLTLSLLIIFGCHGFSQYMSPELISNGGDDFSFSGNSWSWSLGEDFTETLSGPELMLTQGFQQSWGLPLVQSQVIDLTLGWSMFSTYMDPVDPSVEAVMSPVVSDIILMKDGAGSVYWPQYSLNLIDTFTIAKGYLIKMAQSRQLEITGEVLSPESTPVNVPLNWSMMGYLRQSPGSIELMLSPVVNHVILVKNDAGLVYWPQYSLNFIGNMLPGKGYLIRTSAAISFYYPANTINAQKNYFTIPKTSHFAGYERTDNNMTVAIPLSAWDVEPKPGDEIAVIDPRGEICGSFVFIGGMIAMPVWGNDAYTFETKNFLENEDLSFIIWNKEDNTEQELIIEHWEEGNGQYSKNAIAIAGKISREELKEQNSKIQCRNFPNPFSEKTTLEFTLPEATNLKLEILNLLGQSILVLSDKYYQAGTYRIEWDASTMQAGTYFYRISTPDQRLSHYINLVK